MQKITTLAEAQHALAPYLRVAKDIQAAYTLERIENLLQELGNPQEKLKVIHVAGTSGKTSTCYYVASLLRESGATVGLTVSPHIYEINERLQLNLEPLEEQAYGAALEEFLSVLASLETVPSYYELLIAFAYWYFAKVGVDYAVVEVGLGGLLDSTNTVHRADKVCIITDIGLDHMQVLGSTIEEIAMQKAGIIQPGNHVFCYNQGAVISAIMQETCSTRGAVLHAYMPSPDQKMIATLPQFQRRNWQLAAQAFEYIVARDNLKTLTFDQWQDSQRVYIPGRMEVIHFVGKTLVLDGAHNPQKMAALVASMKEQSAGQEIAALVAFREGKDIASSLDILSGLTSIIYGTTFAASSEGMHKAAELHQLESNPEVLQTFTDPMLALDALIARSEPYLLVTGSFFLVQEIKHQLPNKKPADVSSHTG